MSSTGSASGAADRGTSGGTAPGRVVVVGHGMVGSRFVEELLDRAAPGSVEVTVLGAEEYEPYNRVLLSEVVAGKVEVAALALPRAPLTGVRVHAGTVARSVDRPGRAVVAEADGVVSHHPYDVLVLATGARARVPALDGLAPTGALPAGVHALRTLDDAREIVAATVNARRAVVLGGGVLGLEAACGLARRGLAVTVVHGGPHVMDRQLDGEAGAAVRRTLDDLGIALRTDARAAGLVLREGRLAGLRLAAPASTGAGGAGGTGDDSGDVVLDADLLVLTAGTLPATELAAAAGLAVDHGVVVDGTGATSDPAVFALGDCAQPPEGGTGLIAQGWDHARRLARHLAARMLPGATPEIDAFAVGTPETGDAGGGATEHAPHAQHRGTDVVRVKAHGLDVVALGVCGSRRTTDPAERSVRLSDPSGGRHVEVVVRDGVVVGATCVGAGGVAADLVAAYTRGTPAPRDPAQLLLRPMRGPATDAAEPSPTLMPDRATVCRCNGVTKGDVVASWRSGARDVEAVARATRATTGCGGCTEAVCGLVDWLQRSDPQAASAPGTPASPDGPALPALPARGSAPDGTTDGRSVQPASPLGLTRR